MLNVLLMSRMLICSLAPVLMKGNECRLLWCIEVTILAWPIWSAG